MQSVGFNAGIPTIDLEKCVKCVKCEKVCKYSHKTEAKAKKSYVAINKNTELLKKSASGGIFSAMAAYVLSNGGVVFGASMRYDGEKITVEHECIEGIEDLPRILGSKYVQSDCSKSYSKAKEALQNGRTVLFGGTSCQVNALYSYLQGTDMTNLYTTDLICHGVPSIGFFNEYVKYLETKFNGKIENVTFRTKNNKKIVYELTCAVKKSSNGAIKTVTLPLRTSSYYRMFMDAESYQEGCYNCQYASANKPADITLGDYFEIRNDYPELLEGDNALKLDFGVSAVIIHSEKGEALFSELEASVDRIEVDTNTVVKSHSQLQHPSRFRNRHKLLEIYRKQGFKGLERFYRKQNLFDWKENISIIVGRKNIERIKKILKRR
jgi:coenzyme F420-reducing hydrogenase beta subunit